MSGFVEEEMEERRRIMEELVAEDPSLPALTALVMAGDRLSRERSLKHIESGEWTPVQAVHLTGSYAAMDLALLLLEDGRLTEAEFFRNLPDWWRGSDPDDSDPRYIHMWRRARAYNKGKYVRDGIPLPRNLSFTVYRGQRDGDPTGCSWSLSKDIARRFAAGASFRVSNLGGVLYTARIDRLDVLAYLTKRGEEEVILDPSQLMQPITIEKEEEE